ncbi:MAG: ABC transporter permease [Clostridia bacterium]|nr:ABC transporter permease [Clostridia bacterium]
MVKYVIKRILLMLMIFFIIMFIVFMLIKQLEPEYSMDKTMADIEKARREAMGYDKPLLVQFGIYVKNIVTKWDWGTSFKMRKYYGVVDVIAERLPPTILINFYSLILSIPLGIGVGIYAALKKNKWQDHVLSTVIMIAISVPSYVYAFLVQYLFGYRWQLLPLTMAPLSEAGGWFSWTMFKSMLLPIMSLSFGTIAGMMRFTRAELTEVLTSEFMLLARTKGLTKAQATVRHALNNAMVPILPSIISSFVGIIGGSLIIEQIFSVPGVGPVYIQSINLLDYNVFMGVSMFYTFIGLATTIVVDLSYGFIDPRIRMGAR